MLDHDLFKHLEEWSSLGDVLATVTWEELPSPDERYSVTLEWRFRSEHVGNGHFIIHPVELDEKHMRLYWDGLVFTDEWQGKGIYSNLVKQYAPRMLPYGVIGVVTTPWNAEAESRLASQGFEWVGHEFVLDFAKVNESK